MNRRDFLKMAGFGLAGFLSRPLASKLLGGLPMQNTNRLGDLMREMRDPNLSPDREAEIVRVLNEFSARDEIYKSWLSAQGSDPNFKNITAESGIFKYPPNGVGVRVAQTIDKTCNDSTNTTLTFDEVYYDEAKYWDPANPTLITIPFTGKYQVAASCTWPTNPATGRRSLSLKYVDTAQGLFDCRAGTNNATNHFYDELNFNSGQQFYLYATQFSGAPLDLLRTALTVRLLKLADTET